MRMTCRAPYVVAQSRSRACRLCQIDLDTTLAQAEVLFLQFQGMVQDLDEENKKEGGNELRKRKGSVSGLSVRAEPKKEVSDDLRGLLKGFEVEHESDDGELL